MVLEFNMVLHDKSIAPGISYWCWLARLCRKHSKSL